MKKKIALPIIAVAALAAILVLPSSIFAQENNNSTSLNGGVASNSDQAAARNWTGSIKVPTVVQMLLSQADVSLAEASKNAEDATGKDAFAVKAELKVIRGFLVYEVLVAHDDKVSKVIVDAGGDGDVLSIQDAPGQIGNFAGGENIDDLRQLLDRLEEKNGNLECEFEDDELECEIEDDEEDDD